MNGGRTSEEHAEQANLAAQRTAAKARDIADAALRMEQAQGRTERAVDEFRRELKAIRHDMVVGFASLRDRPRVHLESITEEDFEDTANGTHKLVSRRKYEALVGDGRKWRKLWRRVRWLVFCVIGGAAGLAGEQILKSLLHHF